MAPAFLKGEKLSGVRRLGKKYERFALQYLEQRYREAFIPAPWLQYLEHNGDRVRWCQPDGLLIDIRSGRIIIVEIKLRHTADSYWQLRHLYLPVIKKIFGDGFSYGLVEFVKWYDMAIAFPEPVTLREDINDARPGNIQVTIWKP